MTNNTVYTVKAVSYNDARSDVVDVQGVLLDRDGTGRTVLTGNVGRIGHEAMLVARAACLQFTSSTLKHDIHIHFSYPDLPKDGSSWGLSCFILLSYVLGIAPYRSGVAAIGEIDLAGKVIPVNHLNDKVAAWVLNESDILLVPDDQLISCSDVYSVSDVHEALACIQE